MAVPRWLQRILDHFEVPYQELPHPPTYTASHLAQTLHVSGHRVAKIVFLVADGRPVAVAVPAHAHVDPARVAAVVGKGGVRFASEAEIAGWFKGCEPGAVPPLRLRGDELILLDRSLAHFGKIILPAGSLQLAVAVRFRDWYRMVRPGTGRFTVPANGHKAEAAPPTVLVVEDEADTNLLFCQILERQGIACRAARDAGQALALAAESPPAAILLDLMLPDMSGFDMYERLRQAGPLKRTPVVVVTALDDESSRERGRRLGADAYLTKPFKAEALVEELHELLADSRG
jgi:CheY-like chemotaxis protein/prolyl-tRNA editing enzyme YbaK/EbsC (Cys-tRNA(Pro) deacylase)